MEIALMIGLPTVAICFALYYRIEYSIHRDQVLLLQAQVRAYKSSPVFTPTIEGLWPDLDEKARLRERVAELEGSEAGS